MTLVLTLEAVRRLAAPTSALGDAVTWAENVSIAADEPQAVLAYTRHHDVPMEYFAGSTGLGIRGTLSALRQSTATDRYVLVGDSEADQTMAREQDWEYLDVEEAAAKADWDLAEETESEAPASSGGLWRRIRTRIVGVFGGESR